MLKSSAFLADHLLGKREVVAEGDVTQFKTPFNLAYQTPLSAWDWFEQSENKARLARFGVVFVGASNTYPPESTPSGMKSSNILLLKS